jgi:hypothetical protein
MKLATRADMGVVKFVMMVVLAIHVVWLVLLDAERR